MCDLFISYCSYDLPWAMRLYDDLYKYLPGIEIFWNRAEEAITQGSAWPEELKRRTQDTKHMIAIWSNKAAESQEVVQEIADFKASVNLTSKINGVERKFFYMPLEGEATGALEQPQNLFYIRELSTYDPVAEDRGTTRLETPPHRDGWQRILRIIIDSVQNSETTQPINLAVLVAKKKQH
jgi:TIR domain